MALCPHVSTPMKACAPITARQPGMTLLELVIALGLMALIIGMVFGIARTSLELGNSIVETQAAEMERQAFFDLLASRLGSLPGNTRLDLQVKDSGSHYLSDLTLQNAPMGFSWGGTERVAKAVQLSTVKRRSGFLDIVLRYYENEILPNPGETTPAAASDEKPFAEVILLSDVAYFEWRVLDGRSLEWQYDWTVAGRLPLQFELVMAIGARGEEMRRVFWLPPKLNPEVVMRQLVQSGGADMPGGGMPSQPGQPDQPGAGGLQPGGGPIQIQLPNMQVEPGGGR